MALCLWQSPSVFAARRTTEAAAEVYDAGDGYRCDGRWVALQRRDGEWVMPEQAAEKAVRRKDVERLLDKNNPLLAEQSIAIVRRAAKDGLNGAKNPSEELIAVRRLPDGRKACPVFADPRSGLRLIARDQAVVRLAAGARPDDLPVQSLFVAPISGTTDQYVLRFASMTGEELLAQVGLLDDLPQVLSAEPDFVR
ncbi:MAG: hypothetical protein PHR35_13190, partial [Kiritimatiellae bacterium]|nr:hypothetical protein [Kiritimatiellia bacterium]